MLVKKIAFKNLLKKIIPATRVSKKELQAQIMLQQQQLTALQKNFDRQKEQLNKAHNELIEFTAMLPGVLCGCDRDLNITFANLSTFDFLEISSDTLKKDPQIIDFVAEKDYSKLRLIQNVFSTSFSLEIFEAELEVLTTKGNKIPVRAYVSGIYNTDGLSGFKFFLSDISALKEQQKQIENSQKIIENILREMPIGGMILENSGIFSVMNNAVYAITGYLPSELKNVSDWTEKLFNKKNLSWEEQTAFFKQRTDKASFRDKRIITKTGETKHVRISSSEVITGRQFITISDLSDIYTLVNNAFDPIVLINEKGRVIFFNQSTTRALGRTQEEILGQHFMEFIPLEHRKNIVDFYHQQNINKVSHTYKEVPFLNINGESTWYSQNAVRIERNDKVHFLIICRDITEKKELENATVKLQEAFCQLEESNRRDAMTGLINRPTFVLQLEQTIKSSLRNKTGFSLGYIDVNNLTMINNHFGHDAGDELIIKTAKTLEDLIRNNDIVSRFHGDEFVFIFTDGEAFSEKRIANVLNNLSEKVVLEKAAMPISAAIGIVRCNCKELEKMKLLYNNNINKIAEVLISKADTNMCVAKVNAEKTMEQERLSIKPNAFLIQELAKKETKLHIFIRNQYELVKEDPNIVCLTTEEKTIN